VLLVLSLGYWMGGASAVYDELQFGQVRSRLPFEFGFRTRTIVGITPEAVKAGAHVGDTLLELGGRPFASYSVMRDAVLDAAPAQQCRTLPAGGMIDRLMAADTFTAGAFTAGAPQHDDMTVVVVKLLA